MDDVRSIDIKAIKGKAYQKIHIAKTLKELEIARVELFGKKGLLTTHLKNLKNYSSEERSELGAQLNSLKEEIKILYTDTYNNLEHQSLKQQCLQEDLDMTLPPRPENWGGIHPISYAFEEVVSIFNAMGFTVAEGPEIETDFYNFSALNIPDHHPARQQQDTFYLDKKDEHKVPLLLRTHTSPVQIRYLCSHTPPVKIISPGRVYRADYDATHTPMFHQIEGLYIGTHVHMGHLKGCLEQFLQNYFEIEDLPLRFRPSFFPFTEPSAEVDIPFQRTNNSLVVGAGSEWLEILGCGMVHPRVLENCGLDPQIHQGFAFGMGIERIAMLKYGIPDLRSFFENDTRWLKHYSFPYFNWPIRQEKDR